ncbi:MAG TPA: hypothetical protein VE969_04060 [Pyrinomonadaceae bacterium]|nr:hypothetical protein [Pyrinomonadaceae bacterium]
MTGPKQIEEKLRKAITSWETLAPAKSFGGLTLDQFKTQTALSFTARETIANFEAQMTQALNDRATADEASLDLLQRVTNGVLADPTEGPDSSLIEGLGRVRQSERKTGLTRKKKGSSGGSSSS